MEFIPINEHGPEVLEAWILYLKNHERLNDDERRLFCLSINQLLNPKICVSGPELKKALDE